MNILTMMWKNLRRGYQTLLFPAHPRVTPRFRGLVQFDPALCTGCAVCRFRCTSRAIEFKAGKGEFTWSYNPGQCTFCGRCVEGCAEHALKEGHTEHSRSKRLSRPFTPCKASLRSPTPWRAGHPRPNPPHRPLLYRLPARPCQVP
jgi:formate hydrogenlyase subunit 6/NADH:ubiquinone oxidoreductase subunit I